MDFKNERLMMTEEEARNRVKELFNENQADLITKYMFLEQQVKKQKEVIDKAIKYIEKFIPIDEDTILMRERQRDYLLDILEEGKNEWKNII
mgnify:CR=1 FL=1